MIHACKFDDCHVVFDRPWKLRRHEKCHLGIKSFFCSVKGCSKSYFSKSHLLRHIQTSHNFDKVKPTKTYLCSFTECNAVFNSACGLQKHEKKHLDASFCNACNRFFVNIATFHRHLAAHQSKLNKKSKQLNSFVEKTNEIDTTNYWCEDCNIYFSTKVNFFSHCKTSHEAIPTLLFCGEANCEKSFRHKKNLKKHIQCGHSKTSIFICGESGCCRCFKHKKNLKKHIKTKHMNITIKCPIDNCSRAFYFTKSLKHHIRIHEQNPLQVERKKKKLKKPIDLAKEISFSIASLIE